MFDYVMSGYFFFLPERWDILLGIFCIVSGSLVDGDDDDGDDGAAVKLWRVSQSLVWASGM